MAEKQALLFCGQVILLCPMDFFGPGFPKPIVDMVHVDNDSASRITAGYTLSF